MLVLLLAGLQSVAPIGNPVLDLTLTNPCLAPSGQQDEIVICAPSDAQDRFRLPMAMRGTKGVDDPTLPKAQIALSYGTALALEGEQVDLNGTASRRVMLRLNFGF